MPLIAVAFAIAGPLWLVAAWRAGGFDCRITVQVSGWVTPERLLTNTGKFRLPDGTLRFQWIIRHGENSGQPRSVSAAHCAVLSLWQVVHESGIFAGWTSVGAMKRNVWEWTVTSPIVVWIFGIWHPTHSLPAPPGA